MIVRGEQCPGSQVPAVLDMLRNSPGDAQSIVGAGSSADLIQENQTAGGRAVQDVSGLDHLHHEGALSGSQVV